MTDPLLGTTFARYRIESLLGRGGMGVVYRAVDERLERPVALKVLAADRAADPAFRERFLREGRVLAALEHPHIVTVYEADEWQGRLYLAMRYVAGPELGSVIEREGPLEPARAVALLGQVADALDAAHAAGLVHRDIKPANILVLPDADPAAAGHAYLTDFGLTKSAGTATSGLTMAGQFVGTPGYVAPEQIEGKGPVDHRADIYALGCVLYNCLTGEIPYPRESTMAVLWAQVWEPPPRISDTRPELAPFDDVLATALARSPADRFQTAGSLAAAAKRALTGLGRAHDGATPPPGPAPVLYEPTATDLVRPAGGAPEGTVTPTPGKAAPPPPGAGPATAGTSGGFGKSWPSQPMLIGGIVLAGLAASALTVVLLSGAQFGAGGSPDPGSPNPGSAGAGSAGPASGRVVFASDLDGPFHIFAMNSDGTDLRRLTKGSRDDVQPAWSPDGSRVAFTSFRDGRPGIYVMRSDGTEVRRLAASPGAINSDPTWSPDGKRIMFASNRDAADLDAESDDLYVVDVAADIVSRLTTTPELSEYQVSWSPDGTRIAFLGVDAAGLARLYVANADGTGAVPITPSTATSGTPAWSPDGKLLAFFTDRDGNSEIYTIRPDGSEERNVTQAPTLEDEPAWAPDGSAIFMVSDRGGSRQLHRIALDGTGAEAVAVVGGSSLGPELSGNATSSGTLAQAGAGEHGAVIYSDDLSSSSSGLLETAGPPDRRYDGGTFVVKGEGGSDILVPVFANLAQTRLETNVRFEAASGGFAAVGCRRGGVSHYLYWYATGLYQLRRLEPPGTWTTIGEGTPANSTPTDETRVSIECAGGADALRVTAAIDGTVVASDSVEMGEPYGPVLLAAGTADTAVDVAFADLLIVRP